jgi:signal transduction histidine kinase
MELTEWPFKPDHISNDGYKQGARSFQLLTGQGIITNSHLQGLQTQLCAALGHPTTIIEFSLSGAPVRTDSELLFYQLRPPCAKFRECTQNAYCYDCDNTHAGLFFSLNRANLADEVRTRALVDSYIRDYRRDRDVAFQVNNVDGRPYLEYDCPLLGYRELVFPVFFEDRVLAVFFVGEISLEDRLPLIEQKQRAFFADNPCTDEYASCRTVSGSSLEYANLGELVMSEHRQWVADPQNVFSISSYEELIAKANRQLNELESTLAKETELQREHYVRTQVEQRVRQFHEALSLGPTIHGEDFLAALWQNLQNRLEDLIRDFATPFFVVFGVKGLEQGPGNRHSLEVVARAGIVPSHLSIGGQALYFNLRKVPSDALRQPTNSLRESKLFEAVEGLTVSLDESMNVIWLFPVPRQSHGSMAVLVGYDPRNPPTSVVNRRGSPLDTSMQSFYHVVLSSLSFILSSTAQQRLEDSLRILGHELGQVTSGLDALRVAYLSEIDVVHKLTHDQVQILNKDMEGFLRLANCVVESAKKVVAVPPPNKRKFWAYGELLFRWKDTYRLEADKKHLQMEMPYPTVSDDPWRPQVNGDQDLLEQLVYNLLNNAVKYSHPGTKIHIDCRKLDLMATSPHVLTVTDYGIGIHDIIKDRIFELYFRSEQAKKESESGLGVGLYVARQIARAHGGDITVESKQVSEYNVPLLEPYLRSAPSVGFLAASLRAELDRLLHSEHYDEQYDQIVAKPPSGDRRANWPTPYEIRNRIARPTHAVTFTVTIPA